MTPLRKTVCFGIAMIALSGLIPSAQATTFSMHLHDHPNGAIVAPTYGLRLDELLGAGDYTFSVDYTDHVRTSLVTLVYDDVAKTVTISGWAYGGKDIGTDWEAGMRGWVYLDFTYNDNIQEFDDCGGAVGNDVYATAMSANNGGTVTLSGWGGDQVFSFTDKSNTTGCSFILDNDTDSKGNAAIANDPFLYSGSGWLMPTANGSRDWLFVGDSGGVVSVDESTWGGLKSLYR